MMPAHWPQFWWNEFSHVGLGVSVESQDHVHRITTINRISATVHFVSAEPLLGPLNLTRDFEEGRIDWLIAGGESDFKAPRKCEPGWIIKLQNDCAFHGVPFFFKQWGGSTKVDGAWGGRTLFGTTWDEIPERVKDA